MLEKSVIILSTPTCIKCKSLVPKILEICESKGIPCNKLDAMSEGRELVKELNILSVPTVVLYKSKDDLNPLVFTGDFDIQSLSDSLNN